VLGKSFEFESTLDDYLDEGPGEEAADGPLAPEPEGEEEEPTEQEPEEEEPYAPELKGAGDNTVIDEQNLLTFLEVSTAKEAIEELHKRLNNKPDGDGTEYLAGLKLGMYLDLPSLFDGTSTITGNGGDEGTQNLRIVIASFNQYKDTETTKGLTPNTKNHIKFVFKNIPILKQIRSDESSDGGYPYEGETAVLKPYLEGDFLSGLQEVLGPDYFYEITRTITGGSYGAWEAEDFEAKIFIDTEKEVFGTTMLGHTVSEAGLTQTALYAKGGVAWQIKKYNGSSTYWWLGSPYSGSTSYFCYVIGSGAATLTIANHGYGCAPAFCIW
jgi:hypothetical protein